MKRAVYSNKRLFFVTSAQKYTCGAFPFDMGNFLCGVKTFISAAAVRKACKFADSWSKNLLPLRSFTTRYNNFLYTFNITYHYEYHAEMLRAGGMKKFRTRLFFFGIFVSQNQRAAVGAFFIKNTAEKVSGGFADKKDKNSLRLTYPYPWVVDKHGNLKNINTETGIFCADPIGVIR